ncbi:MAG: ABC transporter ATP-binding protein [Fidelibacterota bacterium]|nr:MAG: ABC transporter ATP-binding protein [Candidatus Neomarinimicrobiota bacterium]
MIKTKDLCKVFRTEEMETTALNDLNIDIQNGEFVSVMGPSGSGKSTLLNVLGMLDSTSSGEYHFNGEEVSLHSEHQRADCRKRNVGFVFQSFNLIDELTVFENVELPLFYLKVPGAERRKRVDEMLDQMGIAARRNHFPQQLSGGQQQRVAVSRAVISNPKVIFADEPTGNLDSSNGKEVMELLAELNNQGTTIIMVTHSPTYAEWGHRTVHLFDGRIVAEATNGKPHA